MAQPLLIREGIHSVNTGRIDRPREPRGGTVGADACGPVTTKRVQRKIAIASLSFTHRSCASSRVASPIACTQFKVSRSSARVDSSGSSTPSSASITRRASSSPPTRPRGSKARSLTSFVATTSCPSACALVCAPTKSRARRLESELRRTPTAAEIADYLGAKLSEVVELADLATTSSYLVPLSIAGEGSVRLLVSPRPRTERGCRVVDAARRGKSGSASPHRAPAPGARPALPGRVSKRAKSPTSSASIAHASPSSSNRDSSTWALNCAICRL